MYTLLVILVAPAVYPYSVRDTDKSELAKALYELRSEVTNVSTIPDELKVESAVIESFFDIVRDISSEDAVELLLDTAKKHYRGHSIRYNFYATMALGYHKNNEKVYEYLGDVLDEKDGLMHIAAANALAINPTKKDLDYLLRILLGNKYPWEAKYEAARGLNGLQDYLAGNKDVLLQLVDLLEDDKLRRRVRLEIVSVLKAVTGVETEAVDADTWRAIVVSGKGPAGGSVGTGVLVPQFFGIKLLSDRLVFVLDYSLSMVNPEWGGEKIPRELPEYEEKDLEALKDLENYADKIITGRSETDPLCKGTPIEKNEKKFLRRCFEYYKEWREKVPKTRLDVLKKEIIRSIFILDCEVYFNIVVFHGSYVIWERTLLRATWKNKESAMRFIVETEPKWGTHTGEGLLAAYRFIEEGIYHGVEQGFIYREKEHPFHLFKGVDTIVLFTDGYPVEDLIGGNSAETIIDFFDKMRPSRKIQINTIGFFDEKDESGKKGAGKKGAGKKRAGKKRAGKKRDMSGHDFLDELAGNNYGTSKIYE